jgi:hypothetical protein
MKHSSPPRHGKVDCSEQRLTSGEEIDIAIFTVLTVAFGDQRPSDRAAIQAMLPENPTVIELLDAIFSYRRRIAPIPDERIRRAHAGTVMALFLLLGGWVRKLSPNLSEIASSPKRSANGTRAAIPIAQA